MWLCKRDLSKECEGKYRDCTDCVLDKIRSEIEFEVDHRTYMLCAEDVFQIIDKYKTGNEE